MRIYPKQLSDLAVTTAPAQGYDFTGTLQNIDPITWHGPYIGALPVDPVGGAPFSYSVTAPNVGNVNSTAPGTDITGQAFSTY